MSDASPATTSLNPSETQKSSCSGYEQCREERIKENLERMQKLGILDLSLKLKSFNNTSTTHRSRNAPSIRKTPHWIAPLPPSGPTRRSSRLQSSTPVSYAEIPMTKNDASLKSDNWCLEEGSRPEIYTEEHEKLLGDTSMNWTLFVDGYGKDGKRIYDPVRGKTCHQCRQKTLGQRTHCSQCNMVQGQFCGDCLYMRYGEHVIEANQNPNWICPVCRGICNCSLCRHAKGWAPTGTLYKKITNLGFKSVAHYLIQTQRSNDNVEKNSCTKVPVSAKRSLPFSDKEDTQVEKPESEDNNTNDDAKVDPQGFLNSSSEDKGKDDLVISKKNKDVERLCDSSVDSENNSGISKVTTAVDVVSSDVHMAILSNCEEKCLNNGEFKGKKEDNELKNGNIALEIISPGSKKKRKVVTEATTDSIAGRLRQRKGKGCKEEKVVEVLDTSASSSSNSPQVDSIGGRLRQHRKCT